MRYQTEKLIDMAKALFAEERKIDRLDGWFLAKEIEMLRDGQYTECDKEVKKAYLLCEVAKALPLSLSQNAIFVGTQRDAFARSYALINPSFTVAGFSGYQHGKLFTVATKKRQARLAWEEIHNSCSHICA